MSWELGHGDLKLTYSRPSDFFNQPLDAPTNDVKLFVKHVFVTSDLGEYALPKWANWVKVIVDGMCPLSSYKQQLVSSWAAEDLPLNVSREMLQSSAFLKQIKNLIIRRLLQLFAKIAEEDPEKFNEITGIYNTVFKLGAADDSRNREKIAALTRFTTNQRNDTSLDDVREVDWKARSVRLIHAKLCSASKTRNKARNKSSILLTWANLSNILRAVFLWRSSMQEATKFCC